MEWLLTATEEPTPAPCDASEVYRALAYLTAPEGWFQLQYAPFHGESLRSFAAGDFDAASEWVEQHAAATGHYYALNPIGEPLTRYLKEGDVVRRRWFLIDIDRFKTPENKTLSATGEEHEAARALAQEVWKFLTYQGWPSPLLVDSGNGFHLLYRVDLPNDDASRKLLRTALYWLRDHFNDQRGTIGHECHDARRIAKLPGTMARKGPASTERPHRMACLLHAPSEPQVVTPEQLQALAALDSREHVVEVPEFNLYASDNNADAAYARAAFEAECASMALASAGDLNNQLYRSAAALGNFVGAGLLTEQEVLDGVLSAGRRAGCDNPRKDEATVRRAIEKGKLTPRRAPESEPIPNGKVPKKAPHIILLPDLLAMDLPEPRWAVAGIMCEGLTILAGRPKLGKSFLSLNLALTVAAGGKALGNIQVTPGDVLYLSLEDRLRRVQGRSRKMLRAIGVEASRRLHIAVEWPRQHEGGLDEIKRWQDRVERPSLVIVDVWVKFRTPSATKGNQYEQDYQVGAQLKKLADDASCSLLAVHHCKKGTSEDVIEEVSGTLGLVGSADGVLVLCRTRSENDAVLKVTGRDVEEQEMALRFQPEGCSWEYLGPSEVVTSSKATQAILAFLKDNAGASFCPKPIIEAVKLNPNTVRSCLLRMAESGTISRNGDRYSWPINPRTSRDDRPF